MLTPLLPLPQTAENSLYIKLAKFINTCSQMNVTFMDINLDNVSPYIWKLKTPATIYISLQDNTNAGKDF
jgi:hypothetical protein